MIADADFLDDYDDDFEDPDKDLFDNSRGHEKN